MQAQGLYEMVISSEQVRAGRALLRWEQKDLAAASGISLPAIKRMETVRGPLAAQARTVEAIRNAFAAAGVEFTNGGQPGVRMKASKPATSDEPDDAEPYDGAPV
jgi:transcriptional regulator with XRE-family HTH domain